MVALYAVLNYDNTRKFVGYIWNKHSKTATIRITLRRDTTLHVIIAYNWNASNIAKYHVYAQTP